MGFSVLVFCTGIPFTTLKGLFQGFLHWRTDARGHESNSVSLSFCLSLYSLFFGQTLILQVSESLVPFQHSTQYIFNFRHISNSIDVHRATHMLKVRHVLECLCWIREYGMRCLASVQVGFSWRSQTSFFSDVDMSCCSNVYLQKPVAKKVL